MQTLTIQVHNDAAMKAIHVLEEKQAIRIIEQSLVDTESPALAGQPLTIKAFENWISQAEAAPSVSLKEAQSQWAKQRKELGRVRMK